MGTAGGVGASSHRRSAIQASHSFVLGGNHSVGAGYVPTFGQGTGLAQGPGLAQGTGLAPGQGALRLARTQSATLSAANAAVAAAVSSYASAASPCTTVPGGSTLFARFDGNMELAARTFIQSFVDKKVGAGAGGGGQPPYHSTSHPTSLGSPAATFPGRSTTRYSPTTTTLFHNAPIPPARSTPVHELGQGLGLATSRYPPMPPVHNPVPMPFSVPLAGDHPFLFPALAPTSPFFLSPSFPLIL